MWLILTEPDDPAGDWLESGLARYADAPVLRVTSRDIADATRADRGVDDEGVWFRVTFPGGRTVHSRKLLGVVNRIASPVPSLGGSTAPRRVGAPLMRWLHRWPGPVLNRPNAEGRGGDVQPAFWWTDAAVGAGFSSPASGTGAVPEDSDSVFRVVVVGDHVLPLGDPGPVVPESLALRCRRLARAAGASILGVKAGRTPTGAWRFARASLRPDLRRAGERALRAVARALQPAAPPSPEGAPARRGETP